MYEISVLIVELFRYKLLLMLLCNVLYKVMNNKGGNFGLNREFVML